MAVCMRRLRSLPRPSCEDRFTIATAITNRCALALADEHAHASRGQRLHVFSKARFGSAHSIWVNEASLSAGARQAAHRYAPAALAKIIAVVSVGQITEGNSGCRNRPSDLP